MPSWSQGEPGNHQELKLAAPGVEDTLKRRGKRSQEAGRTAHKGVKPSPRAVWPGQVPYPLWALVSRSTTQAPPRPTPEASVKRWGSAPRASVELGAGTAPAPSNPKRAAGC